MVRESNVAPSPRGVFHTELDANGQRRRSRDPAGSGWVVVVVGAGAVVVVVGAGFVVVVVGAGAVVVVVGAGFVVVVVGAGFVVVVVGAGVVVVGAGVVVVGAGVVVGVGSAGASTGAGADVVGVPQPDTRRQFADSTDAVSDDGALLAVGTLHTDTATASPTTRIEILAVLFTPPEPVIARSLRSLGGRFAPVLLRSRAGSALRSVRLTRMVKPRSN